MRLAAFVSVLALATAGAVSAQVADGPSRIFGARDLFGLQMASDPQVRPDGGAVAYVRVSNDIMTDRARRSIWLVDTATGAQTPLVVDEASNLAPRWSPDGSRLAYVAAGPDGAQLYVRWMATGRSARVASLEQAPNDIAWSPDGKTLAFTMLTVDEGRPLAPSIRKPEGAKWAEPLKVIDRITYRADGEGFLKPGYRQVFAVAADGGQPRQLTFGKFDNAGPISFARDGRSVLFSTNRAETWERDPQEAEIHAVSLEDGALTRLTNRVGPDLAPTVSPDGSKIAYVGFDDQRRRGYENQRLYVMDRDGRNSRVLTGGLDRSVGAPQWAADGKSLYVSYDDQGVTKVARVSLDGKVETVLSGLGGGGLDRPYTGGEFSVGRNGVVAFTDAATNRPSDLVVARGGKARRVTDLNADLLAGKSMAQVEALPVTSSYDKKPIGAWIAYPPNFDPAKKYPLILEIHGGPFAAYGPSFSTDVQLYAAAGYVVVYSNPRGSTSYGEAFANEIDRNYPSHDYDDLMSVVDAAIAKGVVDEKRLYVTGGSGGGALTAWIVGKTDRFRAAATQKPVINWSSQVLTTDGYTFMASYWFGKMPWEDPQGYWARSPLSLVGNVKTPTLVVVGEQDDRTPPSEADQYFAALQLRGVPTALVRVPGASHGGIAARPSQSGAKAGAILAWFDRYK
ncbi:MAG: acyl-peptide hydrolase [Phenylobacterium sp. RIFCSPHIGHO2_01_FULL_69_31]|uniref:alpha/beta hydrolase family protein n=1 Tax=Phenylobacterium sp. RIFCSPHIGHO2_01_FULL_69_31 TaxID=1801944 RepID=UPI0008D0B1A6|nr:S9 family peptidase [Phenylobacterium sp. RIFCSPHIGHO2_01_FULL_69_31]OHB31892.1 MAG: acyl-peptide hydrolase [Phenylobacterium sp. RIFCSPHIGHO2_01_FULL_69_31]